MLLTSPRHTGTLGLRRVHPPKGGQSVSRLSAGFTLSVLFLNLIGGRYFSPKLLRKIRRFMQKYPFIGHELYYIKTFLRESQVKNVFSETFLSFTKIAFLSNSQIVSFLRF